MDLELDLDLESDLDQHLGLEMVCLCKNTDMVLDIEALCIASCIGPDIPDFFYPFGEDVGDTLLQPINDGSSEEISLNVPIVFYGRSEYHSFVRRE